jgi:hypothetical protein
MRPREKEKLEDLDLIPVEGSLYIAEGGGIDLVRPQ